MKKQFGCIILFILGLLIFPQLAEAQTSRNPCYTTGPQGNTGLPNCISVGTYTSTNAWGPLPVGGIASASAPTFTEGRMGGLSFDLGGALRVSSGGGGITAAVTVADGADVTQGAIADAAATTGGAGTVSAKLRFMTTQLATIIGNQASQSVTQGTSPWVISGALSANQSVNVAQVNGVATSTGTGAVGTGTQRIAIGTDTATVAGSATLPAGTNRIGYVSDDPCSQKIKTTAAFSTSSGGPVSIVALSGSTVIYICSISAITDTAIKLSFIGGTGGSCASAQSAIWGSTTAANGMSLPATGGFTMGSGNGSVGVTAAASAFCLLQSGTSLVAGNITYVQQ